MKYLMLFAILTSSLVGSAAADEKRREWGQLLLSTANRNGELNQQIYSLKSQILALEKQIDERPFKGIRQDQLDALMSLPMGKCLVSSEPGEAAIQHALYKVQRDSKVVWVHVELDKVTAGPRCCDPSLEESAMHVDNRRQFSGYKMNVVYDAQSDQILRAKFYGYENPPFSSPSIVVRESSVDCFSESKK